MTDPDNITLMPVRNQEDVLEFQAISEKWHQQARPSRRDYMTIGPAPHRAGQHLSREGFVDVLSTFAECGDDAFITVDRDEGAFVCILHVEPSKAFWLN